MYEYGAKVVRWIDGDTVDLFIDLGFSTFRDERIRLLDVDTPERGESGYKEATAFSERFAPVGSTVTVKTFLKLGGFRRYLGKIYTNEGNLGDALITSGHAVPYKK